MRLESGRVGAPPYLCRNVVTGMQTSSAVKLSERVCRVPGLVDYNPSGVAILSIYKFGSVRMGLEAPR